LHSAPSGKEPAGAVTVDEGAGVYPPAEVLVTVADAEDEEDKNPLQKPWLQVLKAHC
jgi:hypothetical protein